MAARYYVKSYGAEHELGDWPLDRPMIPGFKTDVKDITCMSSNGIANDPKGRLYRFGGEINTPPTLTMREQVKCLRAIKEYYPEATVNHRSNLHIHTHVPGLKDDLVTLKRVQRYIHRWMPKVLSIVEPIPRPTREEYPVEEEFRGALRRYRRRQVSHHTLLTPIRLAGQLRAKDLTEFFELEVPKARKDGRPMWHLQPRLCVNVRQLLETDTIEFRHFPGTLDEELFENALSWCQQFTLHALDDADLTPALQNAKVTKFPQFPRYEHWKEVNYRRTVHDGTNTPEQITAAILEIEREYPRPVSR